MIRARRLLVFGSLLGGLLRYFRRVGMCCLVGVRLLLSRCDGGHLLHSRRLLSWSHRQHAALEAKARIEREESLIQQQKRETHRQTWSAHNRRHVD